MPADQQTTALGTPTARTELSVVGMTCSGCAQRVTEAIQRVPGVASAQVSLAEKQASVRWAAGVPPDVQAVLQAIHEAGFQARPMGTRQGPQTTAAQARQGLWSQSAGFGLIPTGLLMIGDWILGLSQVEWYRWLSLALAAVVQLGPGRHFYRGAWAQLKVGSSNMDTLVALGSTTAFVYSLWGLFAGWSAHLYFMESAAIITLISIGHWLESVVGA